MTSEYVKGSKECINLDENGSVYDCENIKMTYSDFDKESYWCDRCGFHYNLYYDDMK